MPSNRLTLVALAVACVGAAGVGGYIASRQNAIPAPAAASAVSSQANAPSLPAQSAEAAVPVDTAKAPVATPSAAPVTPEATPAKRVEPKSVTQSAKAAVAPQQPSPSVNRAGSSSAAVAAPVAPPQVPPPAVPEVSAQPKLDDRAAVQEPPRAPEPPQKTFEELVVSANSVIGLQTETRLSSETARIEDRVEAKVTRDVKVGTAIAIPAGSRAVGSVTQVERGGKFKERARLAIRFNTLLLPDGTRLPVSTETVYRDGEAPGNSAAQKVGGGAAAGAILGAILGGAKGAAIGATVGAGGGAAVVENGDRTAATLPAGTPLTVRLVAPVTVTIEQK